MIKAVFFFFFKDTEALKTPTNWDNSNVAGLFPATLSERSEIKSYSQSVDSRQSIIHFETFTVCDDCPVRS